MKPRVDKWQGPAKKRRAARRTPATAVATKKKKKASGGKQKASGSLDDLLSMVERDDPKTKKNKIPVVILKGNGEKLLELQRAQATIKTLTGRKQTLESELFPKVERLRLELNRRKKKYIGAVKVQSDDGVDAGQATYSIQNRYTAFDPTKCSPDEDLQEECGGEATIKDEAVAAIVAAFDVNEEEAKEMLDDRMEVTSSFAFKEESLKDPKVIRVLQMHLASHLVSKTRMKPTEKFHKAASMEPSELAFLQALNGIGLIKRTHTSIRT